MPCYSPLQAWRSRRSGAGVVFSQRRGYPDAIFLPCGQCIGCRLERSRQWAVRCVHEASLHDENCFITLTYRDRDLPAGGSLVKAHFQKFMKRLRRRVGRPLSFFHCGEYGEQLARPHYHALLFGYDFPDKKFLKQTADGSSLFTSVFLEELWQLGFSTIGALTFQSAAYCARYALKKVTGPAAESHYRRVDSLTGEIFSLQPEYVTMSLRPAIGREWYQRFRGDVYPSDEVVMRGKAMKPPKYYDRRLEAERPLVFAEVMADRVAKADERFDNASPRRLRDREEVKRAQVKLLKREIE